MAGHNKWSKIKRKKATEDAKKSKIFSKLSRLIANESKKSDGDLNSPGLKTAIEQAKKENMPKDNIERAIKRGASGDSGEMESITYEAYGPGGVAFVIDILSDNRNRTAAEIKHLLSQYDVSLSEPGSAVWAFEKNESSWEPKTFVQVSEGEAEKVEEIKESLEDNDDVQKVFTNKK